MEQDLNLLNTRLPSVHACMNCKHLASSASFSMTPHHMGSRLTAMRKTNRPTNTIPRVMLVQRALRAASAALRCHHHSTSIEFSFYGSQSFAN